MNVQFDSPYYPFEHIQSYGTFKGAEKIPKRS